jgi:hypothetical protein
MKKYMTAAALLMVLAGCKKDINENHVLKAKSVSYSGISVIDGRLAFKNVETYDSFIERLLEYQTADLDKIEKDLGYVSYRSQLGEDFNNPEVSMTEDDIFGLLINKDGIIQIGDSVFIAFKENCENKAYMAVYPTQQNLNDLINRKLTKYVIDVSGTSVYENEANDDKSYSMDCKGCVIPGKKFEHIQQSTAYSKYTITGTNLQREDRWYTSKVAHEIWPFYNALFVVIKHHKSSTVLAPQSNGGFMRINGCGAYLIKRNGKCYVDTKAPFLPANGVNKLRYNFYGGSKCIRDYRTWVFYRVRYSPDNGPTEERDLKPSGDPAIPWRGDAPGYTINNDCNPANEGG